MSEYNKQLVVFCDYAKNYNPKSQQFLWLDSQIQEKQLIFTGLTPGPEMQAALTAYNLNIPFIVALPCKYYSYDWKKRHKHLFNKLIKKSIKVILVDRQIGYQSDWYAPDFKSPGKEVSQISWILDKALSYPKLTKVVTYASSYYSVKNANLQRMLENQKYVNKWHLTQRTHKSLDYSNEDDLPF